MTIATNEDATITVNNYRSENNCFPTKELHIAPMLDVSFREFRKLMRIMSKRATVWTEMVVDETIYYTKIPDRHLKFEENSHPIVVQIGGNNPKYTSEAVRRMEQYGYDEINLNLECPSKRVSKEREFGAALMKKVDLAVEMVKAMKDNTNSVRISVKTRIGVDELDDYEFIKNYVSRLTPVCNRFFIHARKVFLKGLDPAQNRRIPPLNYQRVYQLCRDFPQCSFWLNGGIPGLKAAKLICYGNKSVDDREHGVPCSSCQAPFGSCVAPPQKAPSNLRGCMLGRAAMDNPSLLWDVDRYFYGEPDNPCQNRRQVMEKYCLYIEEMYPRRCCDNDDRLTIKFPVPDVKRTKDYCRICWSMYRSDDCSEVDAGENLPPPETKITARVIDRSCKPVLNLFRGEKNSKLFRQAYSKLSRDLEIRNCGPGFILRKALECIPNEVLDKAFVKTEELLEESVSDLKVNHSCTGCPPITD